MAGGKLEVQIGADKTDFDKKIKEVEFDIKELSKIKLDRLKVGLDTTEINNQIKDAKQNLNSLKTTVKDTGAQIGGQFTKQVGNGGNTLTQFSRIAQDAPFGIIGIGNNITATAEAFGNLKNSTGSTGGALKALASSLAGTGGILLGVSLLTTGLTLLAQSGLTVGDVIDKITGNFDEFGQAVKTSREEGLKSAGKEVQSLNELVAVAQNDNIAKKDRLIAVDKLQNQFSAYYGNLSAEKIMYGDLTKETNAATNALIARAIAEKLSDKAADKFVERLNAQQKFNDSKKALDELEKKQAKDLANLQNVSAAQIAQIQARQRNEKIALINKTEDERQVLIKLIKEYDKYGNVINKLNQTAAPLDRDAPKAVKTFNTPQVSGLVSNLVPAPLFDTNQLEVFNGQVDSIGTKLKSLPGTFATTFGELKAITGTGFTDLELALINFNENLSSLISGSLADTFAGIGNAIGNALATGGNVLQAIGSTLLSSLGGLLTEMGKMAIQVGVGLLGIKAALKTLNPAVAIAAGVGLIALGAAFSSKSSSLSGSIGGGGKASTSSGAGANNSSFSSGGFSSASGGGTVVFEIAGQKLIGVLNNTLNGNKRLGGAVGLG